MKFRKRLLSFALAAATLLGMFSGSITAQAASVQDVYMIDLPRSGDAQPSGWGHPALSFVGGWSTSSSDHFTAKALGSYDGQVAYCIEVGIPLRQGDSLSEKGEDFWDNYPAGLNPTIAPNIMRSLVGRVLQYGYTGTNSLSWRSTNPEDAQAMANEIATQFLIWETIVGERDASFNHVGTGGKNRILDMLAGNHPLHGEIMAHYNRIVGAVQNHTKLPSFLERSSGAAQTVKLIWDGSHYTATLNDANGVLGNYSFSSSTPGIHFSVSGNRLTISTETAPAGTVDITANKTNSQRKAVITWTDGTKGNNPSGQLQDVVTYGQSVSDPVQGFLKVKVDYGKVKLVKTSEDGVVEGIPFTISGNGITKNVVTGKDGSIEIPNLTPGTYTVTEGSIDRYEPQATQRVTVVGGKTATVTFHNTLKRGQLKVTKSSEDGFHEGVTFHLSGTSLAGLAVDEYATTGKDGIAVFENVLISGAAPYTLEEVETATRYVVPAAQTAAIRWNEVTGKTVTNILKKFNVTAVKSDRETEAPQGDATLAGAVYGIYKGGELVNSYTTDANGQFITKEYVCGDDWTIREISPSEGYLLDPTVYPVGASAGNFTIEHNMVSCDMAEQVIKGRVAIIKHCDDGETQVETPEVGAVFEIYRSAAGSYSEAKESERDILTCDEAGYAASKALPYGVYTIHQVSGWEGRELIDDFQVRITEDGKTYPFLINNAVFKSKIEIVKKDAETGRIIPVAGIGFKVRDLATGEWISQSYNYPEPATIDVFYTSDSGKLMLPEELPFGEYEIVEQCTAYGYVLDGTSVRFTVDGSQQVVTVEKSNLAQKGRITVQKTGEVFASVAEADGLYQPIYEVQGLPGAVYEVVAAEDVLTADGTLRAEKGSVVATLTTDASGKAVSGLLYLGRYTITEKTAPENMVLNPEPQEVTLAYAGQTVEVTETGAAFSNDRQRAALRLQKTLEQDERFQLGMHGEWAAVSFGLFATKDLQAADGSVIPADGLLEIIGINETGDALFLTDLPVGSFYVRELAADSHYLTDGSKYPVVFAYAGQDVATVELAVNGGDAIENTLKRGKITGLKVDQDGFELAGAKIGLFGPNAEAFTEDTALLVTESNEIGYFEFAGVPVGSWIVREIAAPTGFVLSEKAYPVEVTEDGQTIEIEMENQIIRGTVEVLKTDADYPDNVLTGAAFAVYADVDGNGKFDAAIDRKAGELEETESGRYRLEGLVYGSYFLHEEKAPEFFQPDDGYHLFQIEEDGAVVTVETEAGKGFANRAQTGSLKIIKTAEDKEVAGRSFLVVGKTYTGQSYEQVFKTDESGEIHIDGLRVGEYTISEVSEESNARYVLPDAQTVKIGAEEETTVELYNRIKVGSLSITKTDASTGKPIKGCHFEVLDQDGNVLREGTTDKHGVATFEALPCGDYFYRESQAADGYRLDDTAFPFSIREDGEIVKAEMTNEQIPPKTDIPKTGDTTNLPLFIGLALISLGAIGVLAVYQKRHKRKEDEE